MIEKYKELKESIGKIVNEKKPSCLTKLIRLIRLSFTYENLNSNDPEDENVKAKLKNQIDTCFNGTNGRQLFDFLDTVCKVKNCTFESILLRLKKDKSYVLVLNLIEELVKDGEKDKEKNLYSAFIKTSEAIKAFNKLYTTCKTKDANAKKKNYLKKVGHLSFNQPNLQKKPVYKELNNVILNPVSPKNLSNQMQKYKILNSSDDPFFPPAEKKPIDFQNILSSLKEKLSNPLDEKKELKELFPEEEKLLIDVETYLTLMGKSQQSKCDFSKACTKHSSKPEEVIKDICDSIKTIAGIGLANAYSSGEIGKKKFSLELNKHLAKVADKRIKKIDTILQNNNENNSLKISVEKSVNPTLSKILEKITNNEHLIITENNFYKMQKDKLRREAAVNFPDPPAEYEKKKNELIKKKNEEIKKLQGQANEIIEENNFGNFIISKTITKPELFSSEEKNLLQYATRYYQLYVCNKKFVLSATDKICKKIYTKLSSKTDKKFIDDFLKKAKNISDIIKFVSSFPWTKASIKSIGNLKLNVPINEDLEKLLLPQDKYGNPLGSKIKNSNCFFKSSNGENFEQSLNKVFRVEKSSKKSTKKSTWFLKNNGDGCQFAENAAITSQIECITNELINIVIQGIAPEKARVVKDDNNKNYRIGSKEIPNYWGFGEIFNASLVIEPNKQLEKQFAQVLAMSFFTEDNDKHLNNYGTDGVSIKTIDFGQAFFSFLAKSLRNNYAALTEVNKLNFTVTSEDIENFPHTFNHKTYNGIASGVVDNINSIYKKNSDVLNEIGITKNISRENFDKEVLLTLTKCTILFDNESLVAKLAAPYAVTEEFHEKIVNHIVERAQAFRKALSRASNFQKYLLNNLGVIEAIIGDFAGREQKEDNKKKTNKTKVNILSPYLSAAKTNFNVLTTDTAYEYLLRKVGENNTFAKDESEVKQLKYFLAKFHIAKQDYAQSKEDNKKSSLKILGEVNFLDFLNNLAEKLKTTEKKEETKEIWSLISDSTIANMSKLVISVALKNISSTKTNEQPNNQQSINQQSKKEEKINFCHKYTISNVLTKQKERFLKNVTAIVHNIFREQCSEVEVTYINPIYSLMTPIEYTEISFPQSANKTVLDIFTALQIHDMLTCGKTVKNEATTTTIRIEARHLKAEDLSKKFDYVKDAAKKLCDSSVILQPELKP